MRGELLDHVEARDGVQRSLVGPELRGVVVEPDAVPPAASVWLDEEGRAVAQLLLYQLLRSARCPRSVKRCTAHMTNAHKAFAHKTNAHTRQIMIIIITIFVWRPSWSSDHSRRTLAHLNFFTLTVTFEHVTNIVAD